MIAIYINPTVANCIVKKLCNSCYNKMFAALSKDGSDRRVSLGIAIQTARHNKESRMNRLGWEREFED